MNDKLAEASGISKPIGPVGQRVWEPIAPDPRRPWPPVPLEPIEIVHPAVPPGAEGVTILHVADLHVRKGRPKTPNINRVAEALAGTPADLVLLTGDYMNYPGDERSTLETLRFLCAASRPRYGMWGIFGNHDSWELLRDARQIPGIEWLTPERPLAEPITGMSLTLVGSDEPEDLFKVAVEQELRGVSLRERFCIALAHSPTEIYTAAAVGIPLVFAGHTHGGQFRLGPRCAPHTSCDLPAHLASGLLRYQDTLCGVSRGLGQAIVEMRINCPAHLPLYTLRRGELGSAPAGLSISREW